MNIQQNPYPSSDLSPFSTNDQVFASTTDIIAARTEGLPEYHDLINSINQAGAVENWPISLIVIGLSPFDAGQFDIDTHINHLGSLGVAVKLQHCVRHCRGLGLIKADASAHQQGHQIRPAQPAPVPEPALAMIEKQTLEFAKLYRVTDTQFAVLTVATAKPLAQLCENLLSTLDQPLYVGQVSVRTTANIGIARGHEYRGRAESMLTAARSALFASRQTETVKVGP